MSTEIEPFHLSVPETQLADLRDRLARTRWPDRETVEDTGQGPQLAKVRALAAYWRDHYDWRRCSTALGSIAPPSMGSASPSSMCARPSRTRCRSS